MIHLVNNKNTLYSLIAPISRKFLRKKNYQKFCAILCNISLILNSFLPYFAALPVYAADPSSPASQIEYSSASHKLIITANTSEKVAYQLFYKSGDKVDSVVGNDLVAANESDSFYMGTKSGNDYLPQSFDSGLLKTSLNSQYYFSYFTFDGGQLDVVKEGDSLQFDLTDDEEKFLTTGITSSLEETIPSVVTPTITSQIDMICLADGQVIRDSDDSDWNRDDTNNISETKGKVQLGVKYNFPQEEKVSVTFRCLPKDENLRTTLKIQQVKTSDLNLPDTDGGVGEYAYDITTGMADGDFQYDITLPKSAESTAEISYIKKSLDDVKINGINISEIKQIEDGQIEQEIETVKATGVDHFSIYITTIPNTYVDNNGVVNPGNAYTSNNQYATFDNGGDNVEYRLNNITQIGSGDTVNGIKVIIEGKQGSGSPMSYFQVSLYNKSSNSYTTSAVSSLFPPSPSEGNIILGGDTNLWGKSWVRSDFDGNNFRIKISRNNSGNSTLDIDQVKVEVYYTPPVIWPTNWTPSSGCNTDPSGDENPSQLDIAGDATYPATYYSTDSNYLYLRERLAGNPSGSGIFDNNSWVVLDEQTGDNYYDYLFVLDGLNERVQLRANTSQDAEINWDPVFNDPADTTMLWYGLSSTYARVDAADPGHYFVSWAVPKKVDGFTLSATPSLYFATSANNNNFNKDHLDCYEPAPSEEIIVVHHSDLATNFADVLGDPSKWFFYNDETDVIDNTLGSFVNGPATPPRGDGSIQINVSGTQRRNIATYQFSGTSLSDIKILAFSTYNPSAGNAGASNRTGYLNFNVDFDGSDTWQRRLIFTPPAGSVQQDTWQEWDALQNGNALWHYSGSTWPVTGESGTTSKTWNQILSDYPNARVRVTDSWMGVRVGSPYADGYTENIDLFKFGTSQVTKIWDFEPGQIISHTCGDASVNQDSEQCDDGNQNDNDYCNNRCQFNNNVCLPDTNMIVNGGFETPLVSASQAWDIFPAGTPGLGWKVEWSSSQTSYQGVTRPDIANLELHHGVNGWAPQEVSQYAELDTDWNDHTGTLNNEPASVKIYQDIPTIPGNKYSVDFWFSPRPNTSSTNNRLQYGWDSNSEGTATGTGSSNTSWTEYDYTFTAVNPVTRIYFTDVGTADSMGTFIDNVTVKCLGVAITCGDGILNGDEECDGTSGVSADNFCTSQCKLVPIYNGPALCPREKPIKKLIGTYLIGAKEAVGQTIPGLTIAGDYLFEVSGTYRPTSPAGWYADAGYTTSNNWSSLASQYGIGGSGNDYGAHALLADLGSGVGIVNWGNMDPSHIYSISYSPTISNPQFLIGDRYGDWFNTPYQNQTGMSDNEGKLTLNVYECKPSPVNIVATKIVCNSEADLPNWSGAANITANTANNFLNTHPNCHVEPDWNFQWGFADKSGSQGVDKLTGTILGEADGTPSTPLCSAPWCGPNTFTGTDYNQWKTFGTTDNNGLATAVINDLESAPGIWVREVLKDTYFPFSYPPQASPGSNVSAEIYCHTDVQNYDNFDQILNPQPGQTYYCVAFNAPKYGTISGIKFEDVNGNHVQDKGEEGLPNWTIYIDSNKNNQQDPGEPTQITDALGNFEFTNLVPGNYWVKEVLQPGWIQTRPTGAYQEVDLEAAENEYIYFGNQRNPVKLQAQKVVCDAEVYLPNNTQGVIGPNTAQDWVNQSNGHCQLESQWQFQYAPAGAGSFGDFQINTNILSAPWNTFTANNTVEINDISNYGNRIEVRELVPTNSGSFVAFSNSNNVSAEFYCTGDTANYDNWEWINNPQYGTTYYCVAFNARPYGSIQGRKYNDVNANGDFDSDEKIDVNRLDGWTIDLYDNSWNLVDSMITGDDTTSAGSVAKGQYRFVNVVPGQYYVCEENQTGWSQTEPTASTGVLHNEGYCHPITVGLNQAVDTVQFGNAQLSDIHGYKFSDLNGNGIRDCVDDGNIIDGLEFSVSCQLEPLLSGWTIFIDTNNNGILDNQEQSMVTDDTNEHYGWYWFKDLLPGQYSICEVSQPGWNQTYPSPACHTVTLPDQNIGRLAVSENAVVGPEYIFGNQQLSIINATKFNDLNGNGSFDVGEQVLGDWTINLSDIGSSITDSNGQAIFKDLSPATYYLSEDQQYGWTQTGIYCEDESGGVKITAPGYAYGHHGACEGWNTCGDAATCAQKACEANGYQNLISYGDQKPCTQFTNCSLFYDINTSLSYQANWGNWCSVMGVTDIVCSNGIGFTGIASPDIITTGEHEVTVKSGETKRCYIGNQRLEPKATIAKSNNTSGNDLPPGASVQYKITLNFQDNDVQNLKVADLLSNGFKYQVGSYQVFQNGSNVTSQVTEPQYHSPGVWDLSSLGNLTPEDTVELVYTADISTDQQPGTYKDLAYAYGQNTYDSNSVIATAEPEGYVDDNFVGTEVPVVKSTQSGVSAGVEKEEISSGEVLGASTELPSTGSPTVWLLVSIIMSLLGLTLIKRSKKLLTVIFIFALFFSPQNAQAISNLSLRVEQPKTPINTSNIDLNFVALDILGQEITVKCLKKGPSDATFSQFGVDQVLSAGGNANHCSLSSVLTDEGSYQFQVVATTATPETKTVTISLDYKTSGPGTPNDYRKDHPNNCDYKIHFKTADDSGKTVKVEVYRADITSFLADDGSKVADIGIGSNQEYDLTNSVPDCDKDYYYVIRAFDSAGNGSSIVGDSVVKIITSTSTNTTVTSSITPATVPAIGLDTGTISSSEEPGATDQTQPEDVEENTTNEEGSVLGTQEITKNFIQKYWLPLALSLLMIASIIAYVASKKKGSNR